MNDEYSNIFISTLDKIPDHPILESKGFIYAFNTYAYTEGFPKEETKDALKNLKKIAFDKGANAILNLKLSFNHYGTAAYGEAVKILNIDNLVKEPAPTLNIKIYIFIYIFILFK